MRLGIDTREAENLCPTGKGLWIQHILEELRQRDPEIIPFGGSGGLRWHLQAAKRLKRKKPCDLYLAPTSYIVPWLLGKSFPHAIVVHDLIAFDSEPHDRKAKLIERLTLPKALKTAKHIFTVSEATKKELLKKFPAINPSKIVTVYAGPTVEKHTTDNRQPTTSNIILAIGTLCPRKNQLRLIRAFNALPDELRKSHTLVLAGGRGWDDAEIVQLAGKSENVEWRGYVDSTELLSLYREAKLLALPSLKEGFGLPVLDAMVLGVPVLTSNKSSLPEVAGDAAVLVDPESVEEISEGLKKLLTDEGLRQQCIERGSDQAQIFTWGNTVTRMLNAFSIAS